MKLRNKVLVVGGAGDIGSDMMLALQDAGFDAIAFDNLSRGFANAVGSVPLLVGDMRSLTDFDACFDTHEFDLVIHLTALEYGVSL